MFSWEVFCFRKYSVRNKWNCVVLESFSVYCEFFGEDFVYCVIPEPECAHNLDMVRWLLCRDLKINFKVTSLKVIKPYIL